jgi:RsiW-degrading membrane proteinase PrsW (M82 family)
VTAAINNGTTSMTHTNFLYLIIGVLVVAMAVLGQQLYEAKKEPKGVQLSIGERGISIETK